jgi:hypothetical protein
MSTHGHLFQPTSTIKIQLSVLVWYKANIIVFSSISSLSSQWYSWTIVHLVFSKQSPTHSLTPPTYRWLVMSPVCLIYPVWISSPVHSVRYNITDAECDNKHQYLNSTHFVTSAWYSPYCSYQKSVNVHYTCSKKTLHKSLIHTLCLVFCIVYSHPVFSFLYSLFTPCV